MMERQRLRALVERHCRSEYRLPISAAMEAAIRPAVEILRAAQTEGKKLVLDAGCGTGASTAVLAERDSTAFVVGVDRSAVRLRRAPTLPPNALLVRARLEEFWLLVHRAGIVFDRTLLLYPNPYPKQWQVGRRWYGHPILPTILATSRTLELRTTEQWYAEDFCYVLEFCQWQCVCDRLTASDTITPFERKYAARQIPRWQVVATHEARP